MHYMYWPIYPGSIFVFHFHKYFLLFSQWFIYLPFSQIFFCIFYNYLNFTFGVISFLFSQIFMWIYRTIYRTQNATLKAKLAMLPIYAKYQIWGKESNSIKLEFFLWNVETYRLYIFSIKGPLCFANPPLIQKFCVTLLNLFSWCMSFCEVIHVWRGRREGCKSFYVSTKLGDAISKSKTINHCSALTHFLDAIASEKLFSNYSWGGLPLD